MHGPRQLKFAPIEIPHYLFPLTCDCLPSISRVSCHFFRSYFAAAFFFFLFFSFLVIGFILPLLRNQVGFFSHNALQGSKFQKPGEPTPDLGVRNISTMQAPKKLVQQSVNGMVPPPSWSMPPPPPPPPPPPKFNSPVLPSKVHEKSFLNKSKPESVPDTLIKLMEYGEEDDEPDEITEEPYKSNSNGSAAPKPFWAV